MSTAVHLTTTSFLIFLRDNDLVWATQKSSPIDPHSDQSESQYYKRITNTVIIKTPHYHTMSANPGSSAASLPPMKQLKREDTDGKAGRMLKVRRGRIILGVVSGKIT